MQDTTQSEHYKKLGNDALAAGDLDGAISNYSIAIEICPSNHVLWSNRSAAYAKKGEWQNALEDAEKTIEIDHQWARGYSRKGAALHGLGNLEQAIETYKQGLEIDPENASLKKAIEDAEASLSSSPNSDYANVLLAQFARHFQGDVISRMRLIPQMAPYVNDPNFVDIVHKIQQNPSLIMTNLQNEGVMTYIAHVLQSDRGGSKGPMPMDVDPEESKPKPAKAKEPEKPKEPELTPEQQQALEFKQKGNKAYTERQFDQALEWYNKALEIEPQNIGFLLNRTAVYFEQGHYEECIKACNEIVELGRSLRADFKLIARALGRIGNAYAKQDKFTEAIDYYNRSLTEHREASVLNALRALEKRKDDIDCANYINPELSSKAREEGNAHFKQSHFPEAIKCYNEAIKRDPSNPLILTNRAAAYSKLGEYPSVIKDCDAALTIDPKLVKAYLRKGQTYHLMREYTKAMEAFEAGLKIEPNNMELSQMLNRTIMTMQSASGDDGTPEEVLAKAMQNPEVREILEDPAMQQILQQMSTNPQAIRDHLRNPEIARRINILRAHGVVR